MATFFVTRSRKTDGKYEHERILGVCDGAYFYSKETVYDSLKDGHRWVAHRDGYPDVEIVPHLREGTKYIQTHSDQFKQNNLLNLPDC
ncbi:MAG: DUF3892 domain-containing protein [Planctomycetales bacterium]|nr:MAG: DUF3892 domain-containing protein [Planctomycetales bacterium]